MKLGIAGIYILRGFFSVNMLDSDTRGGESLWRTKLTSSSGHDLRAVIFRMLSETLPKVPQSP